MIEWCCKLVKENPKWRLSIPDTQAPQDSITWEHFEALCGEMMRRWEDPVRQGEVDSIYGVPRGGIPVAIKVGHLLSLPLMSTQEFNHRTPHDHPELILALDDIVDTGKTAERYLGRRVRFDALVKKRGAPNHIALQAEVFEHWVVFPWEQDVDEIPAEDARVLP